MLRALSGLAACEVVLTGVLLALQAVPTIPENVKSEGLTAVLWLIAIGLGFLAAIFRWVVMPFLKAISENTAALAKLDAKLASDIHEAQQARRNVHALRNGFVVMQGLSSCLIDYLEEVRGAPMNKERSTLARAVEAVNQPFSSADASETPKGEA